MALNFLNNGYFAGKVGIGAESPSRNLQVKGTANTAIAITAPTTGLAQLALGDTDDDNYAQILLDNSTNKLQIQNGGGGVVSNRGITLDSSENVGIGTASPSRPLHVNGGALNFVAEFQSTDDKASILIQDDDTLNYIHSQDGYLSLGGQSLLSASNLNINSSSGNVGIGTTGPDGKLTVSNGGAAGLEFFPEYTTNNNLINNYNRSNATYVTLETRAAEHYWDIGTSNKMSLSSSGNLNVNGEIQGDSFSGPGEGLDNLLPVGYYATTPSSTGVLIKTNIVSNNYGFMFGELKLEQFNFTSTQTVSFSATVNSNGTVITKAAVADIAITIKLFVYGGEWWIWVPTATTYITVSAFIYTGAGYQGQYKGFNEVYSVIGGSVPSTGVTGSVDIVADVYVTTGSAGGSGPFLPLAGGTMTGALNLNDNVELRFGDDLDLRMEHDGGGGYIQNYTGNFTIRNYADDTSIIFQNDDGAGGIETYFQLEGASGGASPFTVFPDNSNLAFGSGHDLRLYHNGSVSYITNYTGTLDISNNADNADINFRNDDGAGGVSTYFYLDGSLTNGTTILGATRFPDNSKIYMGTGGDLEIYHDGSNSYIKDNGTGTLNLQGSTQVLIGGTNGEVGVQYVENAGVGLRHNNVTKLTTESTGINVVGDIKIDSALLSNQENTDVDTGTETVANVAIATYTAAFFDFVIKKTTNVRSGTVYACHDGTNVEFTETSTQDLGDTSDVTLSVDISGGNMRLQATTTSDDWSVKSLIRAI